MTVHPVVHLELHTGNLAHACAFYARLLGWAPELIDTAAGHYLALALGEISGGVVECEPQRPTWLPYVEVDDIAAVTERARSLGAVVLLDPREGPAGWRSIVSAPACGHVAFWQQKTRGFDGDSTSTRTEGNTRWQI